jgi:hypothetical protein
LELETIYLQKLTSILGTSVKETEGRESSYNFGK